MTLKEVSSAHFIGIGGIGVSALARLFKHRGVLCSGSDASEHRIVQDLRREGFAVTAGQKKENIVSPDVVIYSPAVANDNPELVEARKRRILTMSYPEALGEVTRDYYTISVSGTHGKTTTTAMIADVLSLAGLDPTVVVGSLMSKTGSNFRAGNSKYLVIEACEYRRSFLNYNPTVAVFTNIDIDHLDYFKDYEDIKSAFAEYAGRIQPGGTLICDSNNEAVQMAVSSTSATVRDYKRESDEGIILRVPGKHNVLNAKCALSVARVLGIPLPSAISALSDFRGTWRRIEYRGEAGCGALVYDDYGHNHTEIATTLRTLREKYPERRIVVAFMPHLYSRTKILLRELGKAFTDADVILVTDIYAARELPDPSVSSSKLVDEIQSNGKEAILCSEIEDVVDWAENNLGRSDLFLTIGAGDIFLAADKLVE